VIGFDGKIGVLWPLLAIGKEDISLINDVFSTPVWI
jgi:hypothetical protein